MQAPLFEQRPLMSDVDEANMAYNYIRFEEETAGDMFAVPDQPNDDITVDTDVPGKAPQWDLAR